LKEGIEDIEFEAKLGSVLMNVSRNEVDELSFKLINENILKHDSWDVVPMIKVPHRNNLKNVFKFQPGLNSLESQPVPQEKLFTTMLKKVKN